MYIYTYIIFVSLTLFIFHIKDKQEMFFPQDLHIYNVVLQH